VGGVAQAAGSSTEIWEEGEMTQQQILYYGRTEAERRQMQRELQTRATQETAFADRLKRRKRDKLKSRAKGIGLGLFIVGCIVAGLVDWGQVF
jgi:hypothetical protein